MTVQPWTLMNLYNQGIIDYVPMDLCQTTLMTPSGMMQMAGMGTYGLPNNFYAGNVSQMNGSEYLRNAQKGWGYNNNTPDSFMRRNNSENQFSIIENSYGEDRSGENVDIETMANGEEGKKIRQTFTDAVGRATESVISSPTWVKGILAGGITVTTLCLLLKRGKKPADIKKQSFFSKLNPVNWFKK